MVLCVILRYCQTTMISDDVHRPTSASWRVPGLPIRDCVRGFNNRAQMCPQLSAIDVTEKTFFERLYLVSGMGTSSSWALSQLSLCNHNSDCLINNYFSIFVQFFPRMAPQFFFITIHHVIWPSPCALSSCDSHREVHGLTLCT